MEGNSLHTCSLLRIRTYYCTNLTFVCKSLTILKKTGIVKEPALFSTVNKKHQQNRLEFLKRSIQSIHRLHEMQGFSFRKHFYKNSDKPSLQSYIHVLISFVCEKEVKFVWIFLLRLQRASDVSSLRMSSEKNIKRETLILLNFPV